MHVKLGHSMDNGFIFKRIKKNQNVKEKKRSWGPFRIYQQNRRVNPVFFEEIRAVLAFLNSWWVLYGPQDFFFSFTF